MAIAYDAQSGASVSTQPRTFSHTCASGASLVVVAANSSGSISGVTYNGTSLTKIVDPISITNAYTLSLYYLQSPSSGANNVVVSSSGNAGGMSASYTGVSGGVDSSASGQTGASPIEVNLPNITATGCWIVGGLTDDGSAPYESTGMTFRNSNVVGGSAIGDSNGMVGTGSQTIYATYTSGASHSGYVAVALSPTAAASGPASLKTRDTIAKASVKSVDGVLIASVKSIDTIT